MDRAKPFDIRKREVWEAYKRVRANQGAAGVDGQSIADFEADLSNNLYKLWNRGDDGLTETADYCAAARIGMCAFKKRRTRSIMRCLSSSGSFHG